MTNINNNSLQLNQWLAPRYWPTWLLLGILRLVSFLPLAVIEALGAFFGWLFYRLVPSRRRVARINIKQAYPDYSDEEIKQLLKTSYRNLGISILEVSLAWWAQRDYLRQHCVVEGMEHLEQALAKGKGVILLTGHFCSLEMGGILMALYTQLQAVYKKAHNPMFNAVMHYYRNKHLDRAIPNTDVRAFLLGLRQNKSVWYAPDQDFTVQDHVFTPFLGGMATTLTSTARMAEITGAAVVPFYPLRLDNSRGYKLVVLPALDNFPAGDRYQDSARINQAIEEMVRRHPEQYAWIHKRFKSQPGEQPSIY